MKRFLTAVFICLILLLPNIKILSPEEAWQIRENSIDGIDIYKTELRRPEDNKIVSLPEKHEHGGNLTQKPILFISMIRYALNLAANQHIPLSMLKAIILCLSCILLIGITANTFFLKYLHLLISSPLFIMLLISRPFFGFLMDMPAMLFSIIVILASNKRYKKSSMIVITAFFAAFFLNPENLWVLCIIILFYLNKGLISIKERQLRIFLRALIVISAFALLFLLSDPLYINKLAFIYNAFAGLRYHYIFFLLVPVFLLKAGNISSRMLVEFSLIFTLYFINISRIPPGHFQIDSSVYISSGMAFYPLILYLSVNYLFFIFKSKKQVTRAIWIINTVMSICLAVHYYAQLEALGDFIQQGFNEYWLMVFQQLINPFII